jgi:hypothetical protein
VTRDETHAGTPVLEMTADEYRDFLDWEVNRRLGMSVEEFHSRYAAGETDSGDPDVGLLAALLAVGQADDPAAV